MLREQITGESPLQQLEPADGSDQSRTKRLGVVLAAAGVGKTLCLVQIGLDALIRGRRVLHVALGDHVEDVEAHYDALVADLAPESSAAERHAVHEEVLRSRMIAALNDGPLSGKRLCGLVARFKNNAAFDPDMVLVDGCDRLVSGPDGPGFVKELKRCANELEAEVWLSVATELKQRPSTLPPPCDRFEGVIDFALFLQPEGDAVTVQPLRASKRDRAAGLPGQRLCTGAVARLAPPTKNVSPAGRVRYVLHSGGAAGAESAFGACAENFGLTERTYTFAGRSPERKRGLVYLSEAELARGAVSSSYLRARMHRSYPDTDLFRKTLQSIWHQVNRAGEVFAVGRILDDQTVKGGTGWAVELACRQRKRVYVYDQERVTWFTWNNERWVESPDPVIRSRLFCGTGTRQLSPDGQQAIESLFERSFAR